MQKIISHKPKIGTRESGLINGISDQDSNKSILPTHHFLLTCQSGLESLVKRECEKLRLTNIRAQDRLVKCSGNEKNMYELLVWSRFANRVYLDLTPPFEGGIKGGSVSEIKPLRPLGTSPSHGSKITDFDTLFAVLESIEWDTYLTGRERIVIEASSTRSTLESTPRIQSVAQKAIFSKLYTPDNTSGVEVHILILLIDDMVHILLDITGNPLHKRGYRTEAGEAPIKENLAASLVAFANWKYSTPLLDPFCGSGTIAIEAAMMARGIAPGLRRHFRIEELPCYNRTLLSEVRDEATKRIYPSGKYHILATDIDPAMITLARSNADRAGVSEDIGFKTKDYLTSPPDKGENSPASVANKGVGSGKAEQTPLPPLSGGQLTIITNPPYGNRLQGVDLEKIYQKLSKDVRQNGGGFITSYHLNDIKDFANKKLLNGSEECRFWYKKG